MSDHLPECIFDVEKINCPCICDRLHAAEKRALRAARDALVVAPMAGSPEQRDASRASAVAAIDGGKKP